MIEVFDRASDLIFSDKTRYDIHVSKKISEMIKLMEDMYSVVEKNEMISKNLQIKILIKSKRITKKL